MLQISYAFLHIAFFEQAGEFAKANDGVISKRKIKTATRRSVVGEKKASIVLLF